MIITLYSAITIGIESKIIPIEVDSEPAAHFTLSVLGLSEYFSLQMKKRIEIACKNNGVELPSIKITVNLGQFYGDKSDIMILDLPITIGILSLMGIIEDTSLKDTIIVGELGLNGEIRPVKGALSIAIESAMQNKKALIIPIKNRREVELIDGIEIYGVYSLRQLIDKQELRRIEPTQITHAQSYDIDFSDVKGQALAKRALMIAAAGNHNTIFMGPPGSGKTMLAQRIPTIMPALSYDEILQTSRIYSALGSYHDLVTKRPFCAPHHTTSLPSLIGGGINPAPGQISLANHGILFLDEFTEFKTPVIEALRQPLEDHKVTIIRRSHTVTYPANFLLVAAFNPCPCGYSGDSKKQCTCSRAMVNAYLSKISGPILDRIDIQVVLRSVDYEQINMNDQLDSKTMYIQVQKALDIQANRYGNTTTKNGNLTPQQIALYCTVSSEAEAIIKKAFDMLNLSMRGYHKILRIARTIADLSSSDAILPEHIKEALTYRSLDHAITKLKS